MSECKKYRKCDKSTQIKIQNPNNNKTKIRIHGLIMQLSSVLLRSLHLLPLSLQNFPDWRVLDRLVPISCAR